LKGGFLGFAFPKRSRYTRLSRRVWYVEIWTVPILHASDIGSILTPAGANNHAFMHSAIAPRQEATRKKTKNVVLLPRRSQRVNGWFWSSAGMASAHCFLRLGQIP
jgi:hypothetical protein